MAVVNLNSSFDTCYNVEPTVGKIGYMHEILAHLLFSYGVWLILRLYDFEKNDEHQFLMGFRTQSIYATSIGVAIYILYSERSMDLCLFSQPPMLA